MRAMEGSWGRLPDEVSERVLSFLPVPALCRARSVCKKWNDLLRKPRFLDLCDLNGSNEGYLFVTRHSMDYGWCWVDDAYRRTMCFLDIAEGRWYSIPADASLLAPTENVPRLLAGDDGLVCELSAMPGTDEEYSVVLFDPVARSRRELPASTYDYGPVFCFAGDVLPAIVTVVDNATRSDKVFLLNSSTVMALYPRLFVYESSTDAWWDLPNPPEPLGVNFTVFGEKAVFFQGNLYTISWHYVSRAVRLLNYNVESNMWRVVLAFEHRHPGYPQLVVAGSRLFMGMWSDYVQPDLMSSRVNEESSTSNDQLMFEIKEILVNENSSKLLVQIPNEGLLQMLGDLPAGLNDVQFARTSEFPLKSNSVVMISGVTGKLITYDLKSGSFCVLPVHPLKEAAFVEPEEQERGEEDLEEDELPTPLYCAKLMNLSLRNILSSGPVTSDSHA